MQNSTIRIEDNDFNRNFIGIYTAPNAIFTQGFPHTIQGNTFRSEGPDLLPAFDETFAGIPDNVPNNIDITWLSGK